MKFEKCEVKVTSRERIIEIVASISLENAFLTRLKPHSRGKFHLKLFHTSLLPCSQNKMFKIVRSELLSRPWGFVDHVMLWALLLHWIQTILNINIDSNVTFTVGWTLFHKTKETPNSTKLDQLIIISWECIFMLKRKFNNFGVWLCLSQHS